MKKTKMRTAAALGSLALAGLAGAGCGGSPAHHAPKLSARAVCQRYEQQTGWFEFLDNPSPRQVALFDGYLAADARSAPSGLAALLRADRHFGEQWVQGIGQNYPPDEAVSGVCSNYP